MFTVKATYRAETRRFTFPEDTFPSYDKLVTQIYKVFPLANAYYTSKLIFSPNPRAPGQSILIGLEAHNAEEYDKHVAQYQGRSWPGALLKFTVLDETPHKRPSAFAASQTRPVSMLSDLTSTSDTVVGGDVPETPVTAPSSATSTMEGREKEHLADLHRMLMLDPLRERVRSQGLTSPWSVFEHSMVEPVFDEESEASTVAPERASNTETATPRLYSGRIPDVSTNTRLSAVVRDFYAQRPRSEETTASSSERMNRIQGDLALMRDRSIKLKEATEALKEQSSALRQQSLNDMRTLSPVTVASTAAREAQANPPPSEKRGPLEKALDVDITSRIPQLQRRPVGDTIESWRYDVPAHFFNGLRSNRANTSRPQSFVDSPVASPAIIAPSLPDPVPLAGTSSRPTQERTFEEATERTYRLGLDLLRRSSSYSESQPAMSEDTTSSSGEEDVAPPIPRELPRIYAARQNDTERGRLLERLRVSRPLPPRPVPVVQPPGVPEVPVVHVCSPSTFRSSRSPSLASLRSDRPPLIDISSYRRSPSVDSIGRRGGYRSRSPDSISETVSRADASVGAVPRPSRWTSPSRSRSRSLSLPLRAYTASTMSYFSPAPLPMPPVTLRAPTEFTRLGYQPDYLVPPPPVIISPPSQFPSTPINFTPAFPPSTAAQHACGWTVECDRLKRQIDDVQTSLAELRDDFQQAVSNKQIGVGQQAPAAPPAAHEVVENAGGEYVASSRRPPPTMTVTNSTPPGYVPIRVHGSFSPAGPPLESPVIHPRIFCDGCDGSVVGVRHKCLDCENFDFCSNCLNNPHMRMMHDFKHAFFPMDAPDDITLFHDVQHGRRGVEHKGITCDACNKHVYGVRHKCVECADFDLCQDCVSSVSARSQHEMKHHFFPIESIWDHDVFRIVVAELNAQPEQQEVVHSATCDGCDQRINGVRHKCLSCTDFDFCTSCVGDPQKRASHPVSHGFFPINVPHDKAAYFAARARLETPSNELAVHSNVACDQCDDIIVGVRHKCLDCLNFDLCGSCVAQGAKRNHHAAHQFFEIAKPGEVVVHRVYDDQFTPPGVPTPPQPSVIMQPVLHSAVCNLCDSTIRGDRFKCLNCPNFDTCPTCFTITPEHHPGHGFVRVTDPDHLMLRNILRSDVVHSAKCNECNEVVIGTRYKCLHSECPDYDLCQNCEALPIPVHPLTHPLVRLKVPEAEIPCVYRQPRWQPVTAMPESEERRASTPPYMPMRMATPTPPFSPIIPTMPQAPSVAPLIPATWTPADIEWRWNMTPPGPMAIPRVLQSEETTPLFGINAQEPVSPPRSPVQLPAYDSHLSSPRRDIVPVYFDELTVPSAEYPHASSERSGSPRVASPMPLPPSPPAKALIDLGEPSTMSNSRVQTPTIPSSLEGLSSPSQDAVSPMPLIQPVPNLEPVQLWPEMATLLKHLLQPATPPAVDAVTVEAENMPGSSAAEEAQNEPVDEKETQTAQEYRTAVDESPLTGEALLAPPAPTSEMIELSRNSLLEALSRIAPIPLTPPSAHVRHQATFIADNNIADGTVFPPGAEFVKSWVMRNDGETAWPEETTLRYVAGDRMLSRDGANACVHVGCVPPGAEAELVGGEMKAPDTPGKYVSYWRLHDGKEFFGSSIWVEIVVAEADHSEDPSSEESLAASSVIMPPAPSAGAQTHPSATASTTVPSSPLSDDGSFDSSMSLIDAPSSPSIASADDEIFQDSRDAVTSPVDAAARDMEYVVLYDTTSEDSE